MEKFIIYLWASCDTYYEIATAGESGFKHFQKPDFEDESVIARLSQLYQGTANLAPETPQFRAPASDPVKVKILNMVLTRSKYAANMYPQFINIAFDAVFGAFLT